MLKFMEKLVSRKTEVVKGKASDWVTLVASVETAKTQQDADRILAELDRLGRSLSDLEAAADLLIQRRKWAAEMSAGEKAESAYSGLQQQLADSEKELERLVEEHEKNQMPLRDKIEKAQVEMSSGSDARRRLMQTAGAATKEAVLGPLETELEQARNELGPLSKAVEDRRRWIQTVEKLGHEAATSDRENLPARKEGLRKMLKDESEAQQRLNEIQGRHNAAFAQLLKPEAI